MNNRASVAIAWEYGPIAAGARGVEMTFLVILDLSGYYISVILYETDDYFSGLLPWNSGAKLHHEQRLGLFAEQNDNRIGYPR
jgi:hypothetical protein